MNGLIIFIKNPVSGQVKTRLAAALGDDRALAIYRKLLIYTRDVSRSVSALRMLYYSDFISGDDDWSPEFFEKFLQEGENLGERIMVAFEEAFKLCKKIIIIGSDCPGIDADLLNSVYDILDKYDCVIGPANDGGYYLYAIKDYDPALFSEIDWSTDLVLSQSMDRLEEKGFTTYLLPEKIDIDTVDDLVAVGWGEMIK